jgi:hypothetical protein
MVAAVAGAEAYVRRNVSPDDAFDAQRARFHAGGAHVAAFGESRIASGIADSALVANFATPGDNSATVLGKFDAYARRNPQARVILQAAPQQFSAQRVHTDQSRLLAEFVDPDMPALQILRPHLRRYLVGFAKAAARDPGALFRPAQAIASAPAAEPATFAALSPAARRREANERIQHHAPVAGFEAGATAAAWRRTIDGARARGVELCLVTMPVSAAYREAAAQDPAFAQARAFYAERARTAGIPHVDLWAAFADDAFANPDHVHPNAARAVTHAVLAGCFGPDIAARMP